MRTAIADPALVLERLDARYDAKNTASKIGELAELVDKKYCISRTSISKHMDRMNEFVGQLHGMKADIEEPLAIAFW